MSNPLDKNVPSYGNWCGPGRGNTDDLKLTLADVPKDAKDAICWLHDRETKKAKTYKGWNWIVAWSTANYNFHTRQEHQDDIALFASLWWTRRLREELHIKVEAFNEDYSRLYKPAARFLFKMLSLPFLVNQNLLRWSIDESLLTKPPTY